jgi:hypothetical protein
MAIPMILGGAAARALRVLEPVTNMATHVQSTLAGGLGEHAFQELSAFPTISAASSKAVINAARGDVGAALGGTRLSSFQAELHAATRSMDGGIAAIGRTTTVGGKGAAATSTLRAARDVLDGVGELQAAATSTARRRIVAAGALGLGAGIAGLVALADAARHHGTPMAPGPLRGVPGFDPAVDPTGVVL